MGRVTTWSHLPTHCSGFILSDARGPFSTLAQEISKRKWEENCVLLITSFRPDLMTAWKAVSYGLPVTVREKVEFFSPDLSEILMMNVLIIYLAVACCFFFFFFLRDWRLRHMKYEYPLVSRMVDLISLHNDCVSWSNDKWSHFSEDQ